MTERAGYVRFDAEGLTHRTEAEVPYGSTAAFFESMLKLTPDPGYFVLTRRMFDLLRSR